MKSRILIPILILLLGAGAGLWAVKSGVSSKFLSSVSREKAVYYCPMHPTYTSDRPGDCPICNMKLVKRETPVAGSVAEEEKGPKKDICYLHNCPHLKEGKPCPMLVVGKEGEPVTCPICGTHITEGNASKTKKILYWTDPMIPGYKSDKPGKSPMGMDLIPVYEENGVEITSSILPPSGYAPILVTPQKQQLIGVKTALAEKKQVTKVVRTVGRIAYDPELYQAQQEFAQAVQAKEKADTGTIDEIKEQAAQLVESAKIKLRLLGLSDELIQEVAISKKPDRSFLYSDAGGTVWLYAPIYEYEIPLVKVGDQLEVEAPAIPGKKFQGKIRSIDSVLDPVTRSVRVRAVLENPEGLLKPEMYVNATLQIDLGEVLTVPESAVFRTGERNIVFVAKENGIFEPRDVTLGVKSEGFQTVQAGISEGEQVVTSGNFLIDSESRLKAAFEGMAEGAHSHDSH